MYIHVRVHVDLSRKLGTYMYMYIYTCTCTVYILVLSYRALLYISHGVTEYMGWYEEVAQLLADSGIYVFGHDHG